MYDCYQYIALFEYPVQSSDYEIPRHENVFFLGFVPLPYVHVFSTASCSKNSSLYSSGVPRNFVRGGVQQILLRTEDRYNGDLGAIAP